MHLIKTLLKILLALILLLVIGIGALFVLVEPNDYRQEITELVKKQTGRELTIGNMSLSIYPHIGINLEQAKLSNAPGFSQKEMLQAEVISVGAEILPLLQKRLEIDTLTLKDLKLHLQKDENGKTNWDDLVGTEDQDDQHEEKHDSEHAMDLAALSFGGLDIQNGQITWQDATTGQDISVQDLNIATGEVSFGSYFPINVHASTSLKQPQLKTTVDLSIEAKVEKNGSYELRNLQLNNQTQSSELPVQQVIAQLNIPSLNLALQENRIKLSDMTLDVETSGAKDFPLATINNQIKMGQLQLNLNDMLLQIPQIAITTQAKGQADFAIADLNSQQTIEGLSFDINKQQLSASVNSSTDASGPALPKGIKQAKLNSRIQLDLLQQTLNIEQLQLQAMGLQASGQLKGQQILAEPVISSSLQIAEFNLKQLLTAMGVELPAMSGSDRLQKVAAAMDVNFDASKQSARLNLKNLTLDDSTIKGNGSLANFEKPQIRYDLALDKIDLNAYLPPKTETAEGGTQSDEELVIELPNELIRSLDIKGTLKVGDLIVDKLNPKNILVTVTAKDGKVNITPLKADIFKTTVNAKAGLDVTGDTPKYSLQTQAPKVPVGDVLLAFTGDDKLSGLGSVNLDLNTQGKTIKQFMANLNGRSDVDLTDGAVKGFNLAQSIREARAKLKGETLPESNEPKQTDFSSLIAKANIVNGLVTTETLSALAPYMRINGEGTINLGKEQLDYLVNTKIVGTDKGQGGKELDDLKGLTIPVRLKGNWLDPNISLDLKSLFEEKAKMELEKKKAEAVEKAKAQVEEKKEEVIEDTKKKVEDKLKDALKGFGF
ncbi:AsmA family protein [Thiomicrorhabdus sp. 6S3-12]|uniref:AsmA family protein n=1 Tax=Thiomicrorhabdus sp. 6S3-12 TaxID=2819681 RepID=UPI001AAD4D65|nr:AsmA family protein [Thiomicrorhabdus sp. 6S3-12]MBO1924259.1 AsmA family protein [Thiomicrorhabdus sp. 6S3-12]